MNSTLLCFEIEKFCCPVHWRGDHFVILWSEHHAGYCALVYILNKRLKAVSGKITTG